MAERRYAAVVRKAAEQMAMTWLAEHEWCTCAIQVQTVTNRLLPVVHLFETELSEPTYDTLRYVSRKVARYSTDQRAMLARSLHRPGASAALPEERRESNGIGHDC